MFVIGEQTLENVTTQVYLNETNDYRLYLEESALIAGHYRAIFYLPSDPLPR